MSSGSFSREFPKTGEQFSILVSFSWRLAPEKKHNFCIQTNNKKDIVFPSSSIIYLLVFIVVWKYRIEVQKEKVNHN